MRAEVDGSGKRRELLGGEEKGEEEERKWRSRNSIRSAIDDTRENNFFGLASSMHSPPRVQPFRFNPSVTPGPFKTFELFLNGLNESIA